MSERYKLVYRGEVLEGQHPAVVRKRLAETASYGNEHLDLLFSGRPVVVKRDVDAATAARLRALFKQAGARLAVLAVESPAGAAAAPRGNAAPPEHVGAAAERAAADDLQLLPSGSPVLRDDERQSWLPREIDTDGLSLADVGVTLGQTAPPPVPDVDLSALNFEVAPVGATLGDETRGPTPTVPDTSHLALAN
jgi:hypothetical protein